MTPVPPSSSSSSSLSLSLSLSLSFSPPAGCGSGSRGLDWLGGGGGRGGGPPQHPGAHRSDATCRFIHQTADKDGIFGHRRCFNLALASGPRRCTGDATWQESDPAAGIQTIFQPAEGLQSHRDRHQSKQTSSLTLPYHNSLTKWLPYGSNFSIPSSECLKHEQQPSIFSSPTNTNCSEHHNAKFFGGFLFCLLSTR